MATNLYSQSEVDSFLSCEMKHYYAFGEPCPDGSHGIAPKQHSKSLNKGNIGHALMANYYSAIRDGLSVENASKQALVEHYNDMLQNLDQMELYSFISDIFTRYVEHYKDEFNDWEPLVIEKEFRYEIPGTLLVFPFKPDLIVKEKSSGKIYIVDHKFVYNWYQPRTIPMMPQMAKYRKALNLLGYAVDDGIYNQISTRKNSKDPFKRTPTGLTDAKSDAFWDEQLRAMAQIHKRKTQMSNEEWKTKSLRTASHFNCNNCPFLELCSADLVGQNGRKHLLNMQYEPNKYGYGKDEE